MDSGAIKAIRDSYKRCIMQDPFFNFFYDKFLNSSDAIAERFKDTVMIKQKAMLAEGLMHVINLAEKGEPNERLQAIVKMHNKENLNIKPEYYAHFRTHLLTTIKENDPEYSDQLGNYWKETVDIGIKYFTDNY